MEEEKEENQEQNFFGRQQTLRSPESGNRPALIALVLIVLLALGLGGWFILKGRAGVSPTPSPSPEIEVTTPAPTEAPSLDRSQIKIEILNGTGTAGDAAFLKGKLTPLGYSDFKLGNASTEDNKATQVSFASDIPEELKTEIENKLREIYQSVQTGGSVSGDTDVRIVTGLRRGATPKPSPTPTPKASPTGSPSPTPTKSPTPSPSPTP